MLIPRFQGLAEAIMKTKTQKEEDEDDDGKLPTLTYFYSCVLFYY